MEQIFYSACIVHLIMAFIATVLVLTSKHIPISKKTLQILFSIFIPIVGPIFTLCVHISDLPYFKKQIPPDRYIGQSIDESVGTHGGHIPPSAD